MNEYNPTADNDSDAQEGSDIIEAGDGSEIVADGGVAIQSASEFEEFVQAEEKELSEREIAILSTVEGIRDKQRALEDVSSIAAGLRQIAEPEEWRIPDPPTESEVLVAAAQLRELAEFLEDRAAPLALEGDQEEIAAAGQ